jgi:spore maturation protein CgeB
VKSAQKSNLIFYSQSHFHLKFVKLLYRFIEFLPFAVSLPSFVVDKYKVNVFALTFGPDFAKFLFAKIKGAEIVLYIMDAWPSYHARIEKAIKLFGIKTIFFSSQQVAAIFREKGILSNAIWLPEAVRIEKYTFLPMPNRDIDVLNFGRKWDLHHDMIVEPLVKANITYLYEKIKGVIVLPQRADFLDALSRAKITICVPSNITHPQRSGDISTITMRYFQCMASKSIVLGVAPPELLELFGYNPIVEININNPFEQIQFILSHLEDYDELIERNYLEVKKNHTWAARWETIEEFIHEN